MISLKPDGTVLAEYNKSESNITKNSTNTKFQELKSKKLDAWLEKQVNKLVPAQFMKFVEGKQF
jgi:hypothetical protein